MTEVEIDTTNNVNSNMLSLTSVNISNDSIDIIPNEILLQILNYLSFSEKLLCANVNKNWNNLQGIDAI